MNKNTIVAAGLVIAIGGAGYYLYTKMKTTATAAAPKAATGITGALTTAGTTLGTTEIGSFTSWLTGSGSNTASTNSTSGTPAASTPDTYTDTGLDDLSDGYDD